MIIGVVRYAGMVIVALSFIPQVIKARKTKSTKDISLLWNSIYVFGLMLWLIYGIGIKSTPLGNIRNRRN